MNSLKELKKSRPKFEAGDYFYYSINGRNYIGLIIHTQFDTRAGNSALTHVPVESSIDEAYCRALKKASELIDGYAQNLDTALDFRRLIENDESRRLNLVLLEILEGNYPAALDIVEQERKAGRDRGFRADGGDIYDYAERYCKERSTKI